jgi:hypothetical protein
LIDLSDFDTKRAETGERMVVNYPGSMPPVPLAHDGEEPVALILRGIDSGPYRAVRRELVKRRQEASARNKGNVPLEIMETESLDTVLACLAGWENIVLDGAPVEFNQNNARRVLVRLPWLIEQAETFLHDRQNFIARLPNGSAT